MTAASSETPEKTEGGTDARGCARRWLTQERRSECGGKAWPAPASCPRFFPGLTEPRLRRQSHPLRQLTQLRRILQSMSTRNQGTNMAARSRRRGAGRRLYCSPKNSTLPHFAWNVREGVPAVYRRTGNSPPRIDPCFPPSIQAERCHHAKCGRARGGAPQASALHGKFSIFVSAKDAQLSISRTARKRALPLCICS